jgi:hypothetical protein
MRTGLCLLSLLFATTAAAQPPLVELENGAARPHTELHLPKHTVGPAIPGLKQGATPQGLVYLKKHKLFLISCYFQNLYS